MSKLIPNRIRRRIHRRIRKKVSGTAERPRLAVHYSNQHIYAQVIDDAAGKTLCAASTLDKELREGGLQRRLRPPRSASCSPSAPRAPTSAPSSSTAAATSTTARSKPSPTQPVKAASNSNAPTRTASW